MKIMYLTTLLKMTWDERKSKKAVIVILVCVILMALAGLPAVRKAVNDREAEVEEYQYNLTNYENDLEEMENSLESLQDNLVTVQEEYDAQKKYCEESIYMRLDGNAFYQGELQYTITTSSNLGYINSALTNYINSSSFRSSLSKQLDGVDSNYLKEIILCSSSNNVFTITVYHYDEEMAEQMLESIDKILQKQVLTISEAQGDFTLTILDQSVSQKADLVIVNAQNSALNSLRTYTTNLADTKNSISNKQQDIEYYKKNNVLEEVTALSKLAMVKTEAIYLVLGIILGVCVLAGWTFIKVWFGKIISNSDYFVSLNMAVLGDYMGSENTETVTGSIGHRINLYAIQSKAKGIYINDLTDDNFAEAFVERYQESLDKNGTVISCSKSGESDELIQRRMVESGNVLFVVRIGETAYKKFEEFNSICTQFDLKVIGVILA